MDREGTAIDRPVFSDRNVLGAIDPLGGVPERSETLVALEKAFEPVVMGRAYGTAVLYGPRGSGKRAIARALGSSFEGEGGFVAVVRAAAPDSAYDLGIDLANALGADVADSGLAYDTVQDSVESAVADREGPVLVVLGGLDCLRPEPRDRVVTDLLEPALEPGVGVLATGSDLAVRNDLSPAVRNVLCDREFPLGPYDRDELRAILERRADSAFVDDAVPDQVLEAVVERAVAADHRVDYALDLLSLAGDRAAERGDGTLTPADVASAADHAGTRTAQEWVDPLRDHERYALRGLCELAAADDLPARIGPAYDAYQDACRAAGADPNSERSVQSYLNTLADLDPVESEQVRTADGGQYYTHQLAVDADDLVAALDAEEAIGSDE